MSKRKLLSFLILISIFLTLLFSLNFHIWNDSYREGSLEELVIEQEILLGESMALEDNNDMQFSRGTHSEQFFSITGILPSLPILSGIFFFPVFLFVPFFTEFLQCTTLCSLSVRMNR